MKSNDFYVEKLLFSYKPILSNFRSFRRGNRDTREGDFSGSLFKAFVGEDLKGFRRTDIYRSMLSNVHYQHLLDRMQYFHPISPSFIVLMKPLLGLIHAEKGKLLLSNGQKPTRVWYVLKGFVKETSYDSGIGRTSWFWMEGDFVYAYPGFFSQGTAINDIEVIDDAVLIEISYEKFMELRNGFEEVPLLVEKIRDHYDGKRLEHASDVLILKAANRFKKFILENKKLFGVAKRRDIASFLGIKDDSLRRFG